MRAQYRRRRPQSSHPTMAARTVASAGTLTATIAHRTQTGFDFVPRGAPRADAAVHGHDVRVPHLLQVVRGQHRPEPAGAVEDDVRLFVGNQRFDVPLKNAAADVL